MESLDESKSALDVLADETASEEIFGKAFRGGRQAAAGLAARLQREVSSQGRVTQTPRPSEKNVVLGFRFPIPQDNCASLPCRD